MKLRLAIACVFLAYAAAASAQSNDASSYPNRVVKLIVPWPPGGGTDIFARAIAEKLRQSLGQAFVVENRAGASGNIGAAAVARSAPDGYTLLLGTISLATNPAFYKSMEFDATKAFAPVILVAGTPHMLVVSPSLPAKNVQELIALAKQSPGKMSFASAGIGSPPQVPAELFKQAAGVDILHIPYKGGAPAVADVAAGQVDMIFGNLVGVLSLAKSGQVRALAVTGPKRSSAAPDVPTLAEAGLPGYEYMAWFGILAPAKTPAGIVTKLNEEIGKALKSPEIAERLSAEGGELMASTPEEFDAFLKRDTDKWTGLLRAAGIEKIE